MANSPGCVLPKDPSASLVYDMDWSAWLGAGVTISTSTWTITGDDAVLTSDNESIVTGSTKTRLRLLAGTVGKRYQVTNRITTSETPTQTDERSFTVWVVNR